MHADRQGSTCGTATDEIAFPQRSGLMQHLHTWLAVPAWLVAPELLDGEVVCDAQGACKSASLCR